MKNKRTHHHLSESKLKRINEYSQRLKEQLDMPRIPVSEAAASLIDYCNATHDPLVPSVWGPLDRQDDPFAPAGNKFLCCNIM
ncbi:guanine nucleotide-binding protein subunit gamma [Fennellomyces sp. T-0311]|nr:guanine nucleotide-binding protein subunit gamma [Fennellomyces sp. T-0311]